MRAWTMVLAAALLAAPLARAQSSVSEGFYKEGVQIGEQARKSKDDTKLAEALSKFQKAAVLEPKVFKYQLNMAYAYDWLNRLPEAQAAYEKALTIAATSADARLGLADVLRRLRFMDQAEKEYLKVLKVRKTDGSAMLGLASIAIDRDDLPAALASVKSWIEGRL